MLVLGLVIGGMAGTYLAKPSLPQAGGVTQSQLGLKEGMRQLWEDHIAWTRMYIISAAAGAPDADKTAARLLKNQEDIGNALKPVYGEAAGTKLTELLKSHILTAAELLGATKAGDSAKAAAAEKKWYDNADQIAAFLASANPNWPESALKDMLDEHLALTKEEAVAQLTGNYDASIAAYDKIHGQALTMADGLTEGILKQYPEKFK